LYIIFFLGAVVDHSVSYICKKINSASHRTAQPTHDAPESNNFTLGDFVRWFHCCLDVKDSHVCYALPKECLHVFNLLTHFQLIFTLPSV
jgi:hypothetical protein